MMKKIAIIGARGFIGSNLAKHYLNNPDQFSSLTLVTRRKEYLSNFQENIFNKKINIVTCDRLDVENLKKVLASTEIIFDAAGLAWQSHDNENLRELLEEQVLQNSLGAFYIGQILKSQQKLIWLSTNATDTFLAKIPKPMQEVFNKVIENLINGLLQKRNHKKQLKENLKEISFYFPEIAIFSYAFSKYLGQKILEKSSRRNIKILKISDVYGPGQNLTSEVINGKFPARRIQRFVTAYKLIREGATNWIPTKESLHGFKKRSDDKIVHEIQNDFVFPTYIDDVVEMMIRATKLKNKKTVLEVGGKKMTNFEMVKTIQEFFGVNIEVRLDENNLFEINESKSDLLLLGLSKDSLTPFRGGLQKWMSHHIRHSRERSDARIR